MREVQAGQRHDQVVVRECGAARVAGAQALQHLVGRRQPGRPQQRAQPVARRAGAAAGWGAAAVSGGGGGVVRIEWNAVENEESNFVKYGKRMKQELHKELKRWANIIIPIISKYVGT